jgi:two-component system, NarL family, sensor histidine kinase DesK
VAGVTDPAAALPPSRAAWLARGVTATWWYTAGSVVFLAVMTLLIWLAIAAASGDLPFVTTLVLFGGGAVVWLTALVVLLLGYRRRAFSESPSRLGAPVVAALAAAAAAAVLLGVVSGTVLLGAAMAATALCLLPWLPGVRIRLVAGITLVLIVLWVVEASRLSPVVSGDAVLLHPLFAVMLPSATVASMWWWDVVVELDRARAVESRLAAVQERLRLAGDLHDLQGHHLQVIALQLELAERMLPRDPGAAAEQIRLARTSVDDARRGTRELAGRFRGVPLPDELANAADLLRAAGLRVDLHVAAGAADAPADVLGPVVRESTTNVLKHGGGRWARLRLEPDAGGWTLRVANDAGATRAAERGAGLSGIAERVGAVGGELTYAAEGEDFEVVVTVPGTAGETR